jgi:hypothetical protein
VGGGVLIAGIATTIALVSMGAGDRDPIDHVVVPPP